MGEAKRRKMLLGDKYGKPPNTTSEKINEALFSLSNEMCWEVYKVAISSEYIGGLIEYPDSGEWADNWFDAMLGSIEPEPFLPESRYLKQVYLHHFRKFKTNKRVYFGMSNLIALADTQLLMKEIKGKSANEIDIVFRAMILLLNAIPEPSDNDDLKIWRDDGSAKAKELEDELVRMFLRRNNEQTDEKKLKDFAARISKFISIQSCYSDTIE